MTDLLARFFRLPRAMSIALLGLLLAFNAVTAALHPALPGAGEAGVSKLTAREPLAAQLREPTATVKLTASRATARDDHHGGGDPALPPATIAGITPVTPRIAHIGAVVSAASGLAPIPYRARAPPFAA